MADPSPRREPDPTPGSRDALSGQVSDHHQTGEPRHWYARSAGRAPGQRGPERPRRGPRRILIAVYATFALAATARAVVQLTTQYHLAPLAYWLSLVSGIIYIAATVGLTTDRSWSRPLAWAACAVEMIGVLTVGAVSIAFSAAFGHDTVWSYFGDGYGFIPVVLPMFGLGWLWRHRRESAGPVSARGT